MHPLPQPLPDEVLALRTTLPLKPAPAELRGRLVHLLPLDLARDGAALYAISTGAPFEIGGVEYPAFDAEELIWRWLAGVPFATYAEFAEYMTAQVNTPNALPMTVFENSTGLPMGTASFMSNAPNDLKIELGNIWYTPRVQRTGMNTEATYLMLQHAFGLGYRRLEWKCNALNERSRRAAEQMGFKFEGIQEQHMIVKGRSRDTAWFRMLASEWADARKSLEARLYGAL
jgi:RimJ/RimL family protein N-acetyltransferase